MAMQLEQLEARVAQAVAHFWSVRTGQAKAQTKRGKTDQGSRGAVTGGAQMDGFVDLVADLLREAGIHSPTIFQKRDLQIPGFFRPTKEWDMLVVVDGKLLVIVEMKSQVGSFGNNFNNRTEEAIGSAVDVWTAFREGAFRDSPRPWLRYLFLLEDCEKSQSPVAVREPHFKVFEEFRSASYQKRYELLCKKLVRERHYEAAAFITSPREQGGSGVYSEPAGDLTFARFAASLMGHVSGYTTMRGRS